MHLRAPVVTTSTTSIIHATLKYKMVSLILVLAYLVCPGKRPLNKCCCEMESKACTVACKFNRTLQVVCGIQ